MKPRTISYDRSYCLELLRTSEEDADKYETATKRMTQSSFNLSASSWDPIACTLTISLIMYTQDFLDLDEPKKVEDMQATYACLLHK